MMQQRMNIVTPCCRPDNLEVISKSLSDMNKWSIRKSGQFDIKWWVVFDMNRLAMRHVNKASASIAEGPLPATILLNESEGAAGHQHRNLVLDMLEERNEEGWFYSVDDDNIIHENFHEIINELNDKPTAVVVNQILKTGEPNRSPVDSRPLLATPENMEVYFVDTAQVVFNLEKIKGMRFKQEKYNADGFFIEELFKREGGFTFVDKDLSYYNFLA